MQIHWWHTEERQTDCRLYSGQEKPQPEDEWSHSKFSDAVWFRSNSQASSDEWYYTFSQCQMSKSIHTYSHNANLILPSPEKLDQWFPRGKKTAGCWHILLLSSRSQLCYDYQSPLDCVLRRLLASTHPAENNGENRHKCGCLAIYVNGLWKLIYVHKKWRYGKSWSFHLHFFKKKQSHNQIHPPTHTPHPKDDKQLVCKTHDILPNADTEYWT